MDLCDKLAGCRKGSIWPASLWVAGAICKSPHCGINKGLLLFLHTYVLEIHVECLQWFTFQLFDFVGEKIEVLFMLLIDVFFPHSLYGAASVSSQQVCDSQATCSFHRSAQLKQQNAPETKTVIIPSLKFYTLSSPRKTHLKRGISNQMCSCQLKGLSLQKIKSSHLTSCFSKKVFYLFFCYITEGFVTYFCIRWGPLGWDGRIPSCIGTCTCPTQIHGQRWGCTGRRRRCRGRREGIISQEKQLFCCCKQEFELREREDGSAREVLLHQLHSRDFVERVSEQK